MTPDPRWEPATEHLLAMALEDVQPPDSDDQPPNEAFYADARKFLGVLADAGVLIKPGGQHRVDHAAFKVDRAVQVPSEDAVFRTSEETALHTAKVFGPNGWAGRRHAIWWPDGSEYLGAWERINGT